MDFSNQTAEIKQYFDSMPEAVRESIMQSGVKIDTLEQLKQLEKNYRQ